jgi:predicted MFS family arabinose efflux permease
VARRSRGWLEGVAQDLASLYENPKLLALCVMIFFLVAGNYITWGFFSVYFIEHLHANMHTLGIALGASAMLGILLMPAVGPLVRRFGGHRMLAVGTSLYLVMYLGMALARNPVAIAALFAIPLYGTINVSANVLASKYSGQAQQGGGLGVLNGTYALATIVGPLIGGLVAIPWSSLAFALVAALMAWRAVFAGEAAPEAASAQVSGRNGD